jgi:hypothetical protein
MIAQGSPIKCGKSLPKNAHQPHPGGNIQIGLPNEPSGEASVVAVLDRSARLPVQTTLLYAIAHMRSMFLVQSLQSQLKYLFVQQEIAATKNTFIV